MIALIQNIMDDSTCSYMSYNLLQFLPGLDVNVDVDMLCKIVEDRFTLRKLQDGSDFSFGASIDGTAVVRGVFVHPQSNTIVGLAYPNHSIYVPDSNEELVQILDDIERDKLNKKKADEIKLTTTIVFQGTIKGESPMIQFHGQPQTKNMNSQYNERMADICKSVERQLREENLEKYKNVRFLGVFVDGFTLGGLSIPKSTIILFSTGTKRRTIKHHPIAGKPNVASSNFWFSDKRPIVNGEAYFSHKMQYTLTFLVVCDYHRNILYVYGAYPGSAHDNRMWKECDLFRNREKWFSYRQYLAGDAAFSRSSKCAACLFAKQTARPMDGKKSTIIKDRAGVLRRDNLHPGQEVSV